MTVYSLLIIMLRKKLNEDEPLLNSSCSFLYAVQEGAGGVQKTHYKEDGPTLFEDKARTTLTLVPPRAPTLGLQLADTDGGDVGADSGNVTVLGQDDDTLLLEDDIPDEAPEDMTAEPAAKIGDADSKDAPLRP